MRRITKARVIRKCS